MPTAYEPTRARNARELRITDTKMTSAATKHHARRLIKEGGWVVTWLPGKVLTRNQAITAMILAATVATETLHCKNRMWTHIDMWAAELGLTGPAAVTKAGTPPGFDHWWSK